MSDGAASDTRRSRLRSFLGRHKALSVLVVGALVIVVAAGGWMVWLNLQLGQVNRFELDPGGDRPARGADQVAGALNVLLIGVDGRPDQIDVFDALAADEWPAGSHRSDVIMVAHLDADREGAQIVSLPRDSYVQVPGHGRTKINAAFSYGGPQLLTQTVEQLTDVRIDHAAVIDFTRFDQLVDSLGGIVVATHVGDEHLDGAEALDLVRERKSLPRGDLDRVVNQQHVLSAALFQLTSRGTLANPGRMSDLAGDLDSLIAVDAGLSTGDLRSLALDARHLKSENLVFRTAPVTGTPTIDGASVVTLDEPETRELFAAIAAGKLDPWVVNRTVSITAGKLAGR